MISVERVFTSSADFTDDNTHLPFAKAFAKSIEWLYDRTFFLDEDGGLSFIDSQYYKAGGISLPDLVSIARYIVDMAKGDFALSDVGGIVEELEKGRDMFYIGNAFKLEYRGHSITIGEAQDHITTLLIWVALAYSLLLSGVMKKNKGYQQAKELLFDVFRQKIRLNETEAKNHFLMEHFNHTAKIFAQYAKGTVEKLALSVQDNTPDELAEHIKELTAKNAELTAKNTELAAKNAELEARIAELEEEATEPTETSWHDKVRLELLLCLMKKDGADITKYGNKTKAASIMQAISGLPMNTCKNYCTNRDLSHTYHEEEKLKLNSLLQALGMGTRL